MPYLGVIKQFLVFIDESHFISVEQWKKFGWYKKGSIPLAFRQNLWRKESCSLILAISYEGPELFHILRHVAGEGVKELAFMKYLMFLHQMLPKDRVFVLDNAKVHTSKLMRKVVNAMFNDGRTVQFQAVYSPELNPIELVFGIVKRRLSNHPGMQQPRSLLQDVEMCVDSITVNDCKHCIEHVFKGLGM